MAVYVHLQRGIGKDFTLGLQACAYNLPALEWYWHGIKLSW